MTTATLTRHDLQWCLMRAPKELLELMKKQGSGLMVAGGFIRACVCNEKIQDIDCFVKDAATARAVAMELAHGDEQRIYTTDNALSVRGFKVTVQIIHRWTFDDPVKAIMSFDFTIARAAFWWEPAETPNEFYEGEWQSVCDARFYADLAGKRLVYCQPIRNEDAGGSMLRVLKFYQRGYRIPIDSMGAVIARLMSGVVPNNVLTMDRQGFDEVATMLIVTGLLREVDPMIDPSDVAHLPAESVRAEGE